MIYVVQTLQQKWWYCKLSPLEEVTLVMTSLWSISLQSGLHFFIPTSVREQSVLEIMHIIRDYLQTLAHGASGEYQANKFSTFKTLIHSTFNTDISLKSFCCFIVFSFICFSVNSFCCVRMIIDANKSNMYEHDVISEINIKII